jgi:signal transduction histidine kinase
MLAANQTNLGNVYALTGNYKKSLELCLLANDNAKSIDAVEIIIESYEGISTAYEKLNLLSEAIKYRKLFELEKDKFINIERSKQLAEMQIKFETQKKETEIKSLHQEKRITDFKIKEQESLLTKKNYQLVVFLFLIFGLFIISYFWRKSQKLKNILENEKIIKETEEHERLRIAKDIHDDLGSGLSKINFLSEIITKKTENFPELLNNSKAIKETSTKMIENMRDLIWALNPDNNTIANLLARMREHSSDYLEDYPIEIHNNFPENPPKNAITKESHRELFMVVKESLQNIVKHSKAKTVYFSVKVNISHLEFSIKDDGVGFQIDTQKVGNGLQNMRTRLKSIDGNCEIISTISNGTEIIVTVPLENIIKK